MVDEDTTASLKHLQRSMPPIKGGVPAWVIAWSAEESHRVGEVCFLSPRPTPWILGRGGTELPGRLRFFPQQPGRGPAAESILGSAISREQLQVIVSGASIHVRSVGQCPMRINGVPVMEGSMVEGDTLLLDRQLLLLQLTRAPLWPDLTYFPKEARGGFALPDALGLVGESPHMWRLRESLAFAARSGQHTLVHGASGTGKELVARAIHGLSDRASKQIVSRNAATFPSGLIDAELFGHAKNYPNPGMGERAGLIGQAHGSTLFLDEIGELPTELQSHLLRVLDAGEYQRLGESQTRRSSFRLIAATNRQISALKHDLLARLTMRVELGGLEQRKADIAPLARHLLRQAAQASPELLEPYVHKDEVQVDPKLIDLLLRRDFALNIRELDSLLWRAVATSSPKQGKLTVSKELRAELSTDVVMRPSQESIGPEQIRRALKRHGGKAGKAWRELGLSSRYALYRLMKKHGITKS